MGEGIEYVSTLIPRYAEFECRYLRTPSATTVYSFSDRMHSTSMTIMEAEKSMPSELPARKFTGLSNEQLFRPIKRHGSYSMKGSQLEIRRERALETSNVQWSRNGKKILSQAVVRLYAAILIYLSQANQYYGRSVLGTLNRNKPDRLQADLIFSTNDTWFYALCKRGRGSIPQ